MAVLINLHRDPKSSPINADDLNPFKRIDGPRLRSQVNAESVGREFDRLTKNKPPRRLSAANLQVIEIDE